MLQFKTSPASVSIDGVSLLVGVKSGASAMDAASTAAYLAERQRRLTKLATLFSEDSTSLDKLLRHVIVNAGITVRNVQIRVVEDVYEDGIGLGDPNRDRAFGVHVASINVVSSDATFSTDTMLESVHAVYKRVAVSAVRLFVNTGTGGADAAVAAGAGAGHGGGAAGGSGTRPAVLPHIVHRLCRRYGDTEVMDPLSLSARVKLYNAVRRASCRW